MRNLTPLQMSRAAESLGMAYSHFRVAEKLISASENASAIRELYYASHFAARAACVELSKWSKKHSYWVGQLNKNFGQGQGWVPKSYAALLNKLSAARNKIDYEGTFPNDKKLALQWARQTGLFLKKVRANTPLLTYAEFLAESFALDPTILALEFDCYCPESYIHKERIQFQLMAAKCTKYYINRIRAIGLKAFKELNVSRLNEYTVGWNSRLGQAGDQFLLFLDIDETDEGLVKNALIQRKGWLFKTGKGYHFIGKEIFGSHKMWAYRYNLAAKSKALRHIIDRRHVDFSLRRGYSTLRVCASESKGFVPFMCWDNSK